MNNGEIVTVTTAWESSGHESYKTVIKTVWQVETDGTVTHTTEITPPDDRLQSVIDTAAAETVYLKLKGRAAMCWMHAHAVQLVTG